MTYFEFSADTLRALIEGRRVYKVCAACAKTGRECITDDGYVIAPEDIAGALALNPEGLYFQPCETCEGVGYVVAVYED